MDFKRRMFVLLWCLSTFIKYTETALRFSRQTSNWTEASKHCQEFGGYLATISNLEDLKEWIQRKQFSSYVERGMEVWVGAQLATSHWQWEGETATAYTDVASYDKLGCYNKEFWIQGTYLKDITPDTCLQYCNSQGIVGLQDDKCICEDDMGNITMLHRGGVCHIPCAGNPREMCGGLQGVSVFRPAAHKLTWTKDEATDKEDCVLLRKRSSDPVFQLKASNCELQTRYLCGFRDHSKCGNYFTCIRWSTDQATWSESYSRCENMTGHLAELVNGYGDYSQDLSNLPPGSYWLSLRRDRHWTWVNGSRIPSSDFFTHTRTPVGNKTCAVVQSIKGVLGLSPRSCHLKRRFLCEYDFEDIHSVTRPFEAKVETQTGEPINKLATRQYEATWRRNPFFDDEWDNDHYNITISLESQSDESSTSNTRAVLNTCLHLVLGFVSGIACVLIVGLVVYLICRCRQPETKQHQPLRDDRGRHDNQSVTYSSKDDSIHIPCPPSDITYDSVYDGESPFRRTQRLIRMGSANTWRPAIQTRRQRSDTQTSATSDYAWRGMIDGSVEILNTELRHQKPTNPGPGQFVEVEYDLHYASEHEATSPRRFKLSVNSASSIHDEITTDLDALENHYDIPERLARETSDKKRRLSSVSGNRRVSGVSAGSDVTFPKFLDLENQTDEFSNEENIYASIKKTFQKIERDLNKNKTTDGEGNISNWEKLN